MEYITPVPVTAIKKSVFSSQSEMRLSVDYWACSDWLILVGLQQGYNVFNLMYAPKT